MSERTPGLLGSQSSNSLLDRTLAAFMQSLPEHWEVRRLKYIAAVKSSNVDKKSVEGEHPVRLCNYVDVYYNSRITPELNFMTATATVAEMEKFALKTGDVIVTKDSESPDDIAVPAYVCAGLDGVLCGYHLALLRPVAKRVDGRFLYYCFASRDINLQFRVAANGITRYGLALGALAGALFPVPPLDEQRRIADYLDEKTAAIDALIAKRGRHIELLEEKRLVEVWERVTKGLTEASLLRDSGIPWVGHIPGGWSIAPLFTKYEVQLGKMLNPDASGGGDPLPYLRNADVQWDRVDVENLRVMSFTTAERAKLRLRPGDLLICEGGEVGRTAMWRGELEECYYQKAIHRVRPHHNTDNPRFLFYLMRAAAFRGAFLAEGNKSTIIHLTAEKLRAHRFPFPPRDEQDAIVAFLDGRGTAVQTLKQRQKLLIDKLREFRQTLISAAVTGQIPVREEVPA